MPSPLANRGHGTVIARTLGRSLAIRELDAGSYNGRELEIHAINNGFYDIERFGVRFVAAPRRCAARNRSGDAKDVHNTAAHRSTRALLARDFSLMISASAALERLREGNRRFISGVRGRESFVSQARRREFVAGQEPLAVILGCSDSRVPVEIVFDQGLGDLFVIRVAGNIVAPSQIGSVEFAAEQFGTRLVVVLGHTRCGAVQATLQELQQSTVTQSRNQSFIVARIRPSVEALLGTELGRDQEALMRHAVRANVRVAADHLRHGSEVLERLIRNDGLRVVGAEYSLESGIVDFFDGLTDSG